MSAFIGIVEDNEPMVLLFKRKFKDAAIIATSFEEFKEQLLPIADQIKIWFLDVEVPKEKGAMPNPKIGFEIAEILKKLEPNTPRYCISGSHESETLFTASIGKNLRNMSAKVNELLQQ